MYGNDTITPPQRSFLVGLLTARCVSLGFPNVEAMLEAMQVDNLTKRDASTLIERLKAMPADPDVTMPQVVADSPRKGTGNRAGRCHGCGHLVGKDEGFYFLHGAAWAVHHKAGQCSTAPAPAPVEVTEGFYKVGDQFILVYKTRNDRLAGKVLVGRTFRYQQGAVHQAAMGVPVTAAEAAAFGVAHGYCVACGKDLTDPRSNPALGGVGYGPVCAKKYGWPWGEVTA